MIFSEFYSSLRAHLHGKRPRRKAAGDVIFMVTDAEGEHRMTVKLDPQTVQVLDRGVPITERPFAIMRGGLADCVAFVEHSDLSALTRLQVYGDVELFEAVANVADQPRDFLTVRSNGSLQSCS